MSGHKRPDNIRAVEALKKLKEGNRHYIDSVTGRGDISLARRRETYENGQNPYAIIIACSDSRVVPKAIFSGGIGDVFVIRVAGNVTDDHQLGSIEYAIDHLGCRLVVVLGHTHCGAVGAAMSGGAGGYISSITDVIKKAIGDEKDDYLASRLNVLYAMQHIEEELHVTPLSDDDEVHVIGAIYKIDDGTVDFFE